MFIHVFLFIFFFINLLVFYLDTNDTSQPEHGLTQPEINEVYPGQRHNDGVEECSDCYCAPCITHEGNRQMWWPDSNEDAKHANASQKKRLYQRFWAMLYNCGAWQDPRYLRKKTGQEPQTFIHMAQTGAYA